jgi:hypothetical protein
MLVAGKTLVTATTPYILQGQMRMNIWIKAEIFAKRPSTKHYNRRWQSPTSYGSAASTDKTATAMPPSTGRNDNNFGNCH